MERSSTAPKLTPHSVEGEERSSSSSNTPKEVNARQRGQFMSIALNMSLKLAIVILVPIIGGVELDKFFNSQNVFLFIGLGVAVLASVAVMWQTVQIANSLPVPKLTTAQRDAIQKSYEEEDDD